MEKLKTYNTCKNKILLLLTSLVIIFTFWGVNPSKINALWLSGTTADGLEYQTLDDGCYIKGYTGDNLNVIIPSEIDGYKVKEIAQCAFYGSRITSITIPESVTRIGNCAFYDCRSLTQITILGNVLEMGEEVFSRYDSTYPEHINNSITFRVVNYSMIDLWLKLKGFTKFEYISSYNVGATLKSDDGEYKVLTKGIEPTSESLEPEVSFIKPTRKNITKIVIPATITVDNIVYKVTAIDSNAYKNNKKLKSVIISKNIKTIGKKAFYGCKNLKKVTFKNSMLTTIENKAFKKTYKKIVFKCPKKKLKKYKKLLKKAGAPKKAIYKG